MTIESVSCAVSIEDGRTGYSLLIWVPNDRATLDRISEEFEAYVDANIGQSRSSGCHESPSWHAPVKTQGDILATGWSGGYPTEYPGPLRSSKTTSRTSSKPAASAPSVSVPKGPTPNQLKYQRELEAYNARLAEIENIKADTAARHASNQAAAKQVMGRHDQNMARHNQEVAAADAAKRRYEQELADHQRLVEQMRTKEEKNRLVDWREAVVVCTLNPSDGQSQFGNWRCDGPLQFTYAKLGSGGAPSQQALTALSEACGGRRESVRDLGMVAGNRLFGCSFGLHPNTKSGFHLDAAAKHGISFVPGRAIYRCPAWQSYCRTK